MAKKPDPSSEVQPPLESQPPAASQPSADQQPPADPQAPVAIVKVRLLVDHSSGRAGSLAVLDADIAAGLVASGSADDHPDAVAYAEQLKTE